MNAVRTALIEERRWFTLDAIAQMETRKLNEQIILRVLHQAGRPANTEDLRNDLLLLERADCVRIEKLPGHAGGELWVAELTANGLSTRDCLRTVHGVASRRPL